MANQFMLLNTTLGQALDRSSLPGISDEVREQVRRSDSWSILFILVFNVIVVISNLLCSSGLFYLLP